MEEKLDSTTVGWLAKLRGHVETVKWVGTSGIIAATFCRALGFHLADLILSLIGALGWSYGAVIMREKQLVIINIFIVSFLLYGIFK